MNNNNNNPVMNPMDPRNMSENTSNNDKLKGITLESIMNTWRFNLRVCLRLLIKDGSKDTNSAKYNASKTSALLFLLI